MGKRGQKFAEQIKAANEETDRIIERIRVRNERARELADEAIIREYVEAARARMVDRVAEVDQVTKQKVLDLLREGYSIGEVSRELDLDMDVVCEIISQNIDSDYILRKEAL